MKDDDYYKDFINKIDDNKNSMFDKIKINNDNKNSMYDKIIKYTIENNGYIGTYGGFDALSGFNNGSALATFKMISASLQALSIPPTPGQAMPPLQPPIQFIPNTVINTTPLPSQVPLTVKPMIQSPPIKKEEGIPPSLQKFLVDMFECSKSGDFRGWILPNGELVSQYSNERGNRQDHSKLIKLFLKGLEDYDKKAHSEVMDLYDGYLSINYGKSDYIGSDIYESFATEVLGWMQVSAFGTKRVICRGERWQDKYIGPFINGLGFYLETSDKGDCYNYLFPNIYDNTKEVFAMGLEKTYAEEAARAR